MPIDCNARVKRCNAAGGQGACETIAPRRSDKEGWRRRTHSPIISPYFPRKQRRQVDAPRPEAGGCHRCGTKSRPPDTPRSGCASSVGSSECDATATDKS